MLRSVTLVMCSATGSVRAAGVAGAAATIDAMAERMKAAVSLKAMSEETKSEERCRAKREKSAQRREVADGSC